MTDRSVVLTGASTGIGRATVTELVKAGFRVWATVRREVDADGLRRQFGERVTPLLVDLEDHASVRAAGERVCAAGSLYGLVNNAGAAFPAPLELLPIDAFRRQLDINLVGQLLMTQVMLPALFASAEQSGDARIVMIGSVSGRIAGPFLGAYSTTKHGLVGLTGSLRAELAPSGIKVLLIEPGAIATPIWDRGRAIGAELTPPDSTSARYAQQIRGATDLARRSSVKALSPEVPARIITEALSATNPKPRQSVGRDAKAVAVLVRLLPFRLVYRITNARH